MSVGTARWRAERPDAVALADDRTSRTWAELDERLDRVAGGVAALDLGPERRVAVFAENSVETVEAHLGGVLAGASTVPVSFHLTVPEVAYILEDSGARVLFVGPETAGVGLAAAQRAGVPHVIGWRCEPGAGLARWEDFLKLADPAGASPDVAPLPHLHYTSGTTGRPKGTETPPAMFAGGATMTGHVEAVRANPLYSLGGTALVVGPLYHTGPLSTVRGLFAGVGLVVLGRFEPEATLRAIERHRVTSTVMVPTHFQRLLGLRPEVRARYDTSSLVFVFHTGSACPVDVKRAMIEWWGPVLFEAYGATEAGTVAAISSAEWLEHPGSVGRAIAPFEALVVGDDDSVLGPGEVGQLYFRDGSGRGIVYRNDSAKTASVHREPGVFTLGEIGYLDAEGYIFITDRSSDMVVSGGVNIYPAEAEQVLLEHPDVRDVACIGVPDPVMGEQLKALVVATESAGRPGEDELIAFCRDRLAHFKAPRSVDFVDDLGRNTMGKLNKRQLRAPYWPSDRTIG